LVKLTKIVIIACLPIFLFVNLYFSSKIYAFQFIKEYALPFPTDFHSSDNIFLHLRLQMYITELGGWGSIPGHGNNL